MILSKFIEGLQILRPHYTGGDGYHIGADHDIFSTYATATPLTDDEVARMAKLGWFQPEVAENKYDAGEGWSALT